MNYKNLIILVLLFSLSFPLMLVAKPMPTPTIDEAVKSEYIIIAEYLGYLPKFEKIEYFKPPVAKYKVIRIVKGENLSKVIRVRYDFSDGSACLSPKNWKFTRDMMPKSKSKWILFLNRTAIGNFLITDRGSFGRWEANENNVLEVETLIKNKR